MQEIIDKIHLWNENFNILDFFDRDNPSVQNASNAAYAIITSKQAINILTEGTGLGTHNDTQYEVLGALLNFKLPKTRPQDDFQAKLYYSNLTKAHILLNDVISMRMINEKRGYICIMFIPPKISESTFLMFEKYMQKIGSELEGYLSSLPWATNQGLFYYSDEEAMTNDYTKVINYARSKVVPNMADTEDINIIGSSFAYPQK